MKPYLRPYTPVLDVLHTLNLTAVLKRIPLGFRFHNRSDGWVSAAGPHALAARLACVLLWSWHHEEPLRQLAHQTHADARRVAPVDSGPCLAGGEPWMHSLTRRSENKPACAHHLRRRASTQSAQRGSFPILAERLAWSAKTIPTPLGARHCGPREFGWRRNRPLHLCGAHQEVLVLDGRSTCKIVGERCTSLFANLV